MGRQPKADNPDPEIMRRRLRQRVNQQRAVEKKRQAVDDFQTRLDNIKKMLGNNFAKYSMLNKEIESLIHQLRRRNLTYEDRHKMDIVEQRVLELNASTQADQNRVGLANGSEPIQPEPPAKRRRSTRIADQTVPVNG